MRLTTVHFEQGARYFANSSSGSARAAASALSSSATDVNALNVEGSPEPLQQTPNVNLSLISWRQWPLVNTEGYPWARWVPVWALLVHHLAPDCLLSRNQLDHINRSFLFISYTNHCGYKKKFVQCLSNIFVSVPCKRYSCSIIVS